MKTLHLVPTSYEILYEAMLLNSEGYKGAELRVANKILDKFERAGTLKDGEDGERGIYTLLEDAGREISLEDTEFELLNKAFNSVQWSGRSLRKVAKVYELLENPSAG